MKNFKSYQDFAFFTIRENLTIAKYCLDTPKKAGTNSCYGMTALLILTSVIDTIGTFYRSGSFKTISYNDVQQNNLGKPSEHFSVFYTKFLIDKCSQELFVKKFYEFARCRATHNSVLGPKIRITINRHVNAPCIWEKHEVLHIQLKDLYNIVKAAFSTMLEESCYQPKNTQFGPTTGGTINM